MKDCEICTIVPLVQPEFTLLDGEFWVANLRHGDQTLLGTSFITAKRHVPELDMLSQEEDLEFITIRNAIIKAIREAFNPVTFNVSCLKNDAFRGDPDNIPSEAGHVHWHIKPRYGTQAVEFAGEIFQDPEPGKYLGHYGRHKPRHDTVIAIAEAIKKNLR